MIAIDAPMVDLFAGAGGLSQGFARAGFQPIAASEWDTNAAATYRNFHKSEHPDSRLSFYEGDVALHDFTKLKGQVRLVVGGPPCQPYSTGGFRRGALDSRDGIPQFIRVVAETQPELVVMENVPGLSQGRLKGILRETVSVLEGMNFTVSVRVLHAADYGVSQRRKRLFVVGTRRGNFQWPKPTHGANASQPWIPSSEVISLTSIEGTPNPSKVTYARRPDIRPSPYDGHLWNGGGRPINPDGLVPTLLASMGGNKTPWIDTLGVVPEYHKHLLAGGEPRTGVVNGARRITVQEAASIQGFPSDMIWFGKPSSQYRQIGNAVPVNLARAVGSAVARVISN